ncbi:hypothetical protein K838_05682 [Mycobacterium tuberculosis TKK-01-0007]|uniref:Cupin domain-containing protein n=1 Tax=Mycobacterium tuberculosis TaxID=1773 RepID=A0A0T5Y3N6_MYCTX|nr:conserved hypothetical protein [Mycobacterium tuberculosis F11]ACT25350.1 conserved hypothetical protein [Mycobacterium tuberculosis KZN 1435]AEB04419.1 conserved hypothetical protein [Mycobacterium tuberculosis KZN 4207]AEN00170.1 hypothetical protein MTCTRI2_1747 [Mycobacterium tuberculosis CTRI-2]AFM49670.1 hypothetical protein TBXG_002260 [Mycobacterium tuberculosis KZN 605]EPZ64727.1 hypothetical protein TBKG_00064 [Mycobacterium tuberculosis '98-R604 INH-RIF-EM']KAK93972.1 hypothetic
MKLTRASQAPRYVAPAHHEVSTMRLQGREAGRTERFWVGLSVYRPGGTAEPAPTREETVYVVLDGELVVTVDGAETVLGGSTACTSPKANCDRYTTARIVRRCCW